MELKDAEVYDKISDYFMPTLYWHYNINKIKCHEFIRGESLAFHTALARSHNGQKIVLLILNYNHNFIDILYILKKMFFQSSVSVSQTIYGEVVLIKVIFFQTFFIFLVTGLNLP